MGTWAGWLAGSQWWWQADVTNMWPRLLSGLSSIRPATCSCTFFFVSFLFTLRVGYTPRLLRSFDDSLFLLYA